MQMGTRTHLRGQNTSERTKRWSHTRKEERVKVDEVVKYMSKLPGYLQGEEEESNVLNVGVLDWGRLEKWKQRGRAKCGGRSSKRESKVSSTTTTLGTVPNGGSSSSHQYRHHRCKVDVQVHASSLLGKVKAASRDAFNKQEIATCSYKDRRPTSGLLPEMGNSNGSLGPKGNLVIRYKKESEKRAQEEARESGKQCAEKLIGEDKTLGDSNDNLKVTREVSSLFSDGISSSLGLTSQVPPPSCPLSFHLERDSEDLRLGVDLSCKKERFCGLTSHSKPASSRIFDQEIRQEKNTHSKRFSFSFGRLSRSHTFKEDSSAGGQPLTSSSNDAIKSDSKRCDGSACPPQSSNPEEKHCGSSRVSPLRRLLDPLLKSKGSENVLPSKEERSTCSNPKPTDMDEKKQDTSRRTRALLQLTNRNGVPLFQFVVDDDNLNNNSRRSILGATMKNSDSSFKDDSVQYCTFYSVDEVKKKKRSGSWLIHGHKEKQQRGFVYTVISQMRLCNNSMSSDITEKNVSCIIREAVLFDETEEQVKGRKEFAAVVIKKKPAEENLNALEETTVIIPGGVHSFPVKGAPTPLVTRWRSGGLCDCGGWDVGCKLHVLSNKTLLHELDHSFKLFDQEESDQDSVPILAMTELKTGMYRVEFGSFLSPLQAFFVCVTVITCASDSEEETMSKTTGRSSSPFAPPLSPVGRV
ncbi:hypothetical protein F2Q69_00000069 [Brassica cretica]|uniref:DUF3527 domain-containing protein n=1 Tax=Brassica cretica TaxID=69181 RepID=A0A8S9NMI5_BRACR|nr:hypothetical protein F2Q69_00000069 [Brassica cretica]